MTKIGRRSVNATQDIVTMLTSVGRLWVEEINPILPEVSERIDATIQRLRELMETHHNSQLNHCPNHEAETASIHVTWNCTFNTYEVYLLVYSSADPFTARFE